MAVNAARVPTIRLVAPVDGQDRAVLRIPAGRRVGRKGAEWGTTNSTPAR